MTERSMSRILIVRTGLFSRGDSMNEDSLSMILKGVRRLLVLGIGNEFQGDDGVGVALARRLRKRWRSSKDSRAMDVGLNPENAIAVVRRYGPTHVLLVDAADMGLPPGSIRIVERGRVSGLNISTHGISLSLIADYLEREIGAKITLIGIQPFRVGPVTAISGPVAKSIDLLEVALSNAAKKGS